MKEDRAEIGESALRMAARSHRRRTTALRSVIFLHCREKGVDILPACPRRDVTAGGDDEIGISATVFHHAEGCRPNGIGSAAIQRANGTLGRSP